MISRVTAAVVVLTSVIAACGGPASESEADGADPGRIESKALVVLTTNYPQAYFAERIGGDRVRVEFPAPPGIDPAYWSPSAEVVAAYQGADVIFSNGAGYEGWVAKTSLPESKLVSTSSGFEDLYLVAEEAVLHTHGPEGEHEHENVALTTWLDPMLAIEQARAIKDALTERLPGAEADLQAGFAVLEMDLTDIDGQLQAWATARAGQPMLASHPVYQYLARRYGLDLRSVHFEPDEIPTPGAWRDLADLVAEHPAKLMLWEGSPLPEIEARLREQLGIATVVFEPCANRPPAGDYLSVMRANANRIATM